MLEMLSENILSIGGSMKVNEVVMEILVKMIFRFFDFFFVCT